MSSTTMRSSAPLSATYVGYIGSTQDALILFESCLSGKLTHVPRRPHDRERASLIKSGNVFIYEEHSSGIKRWTDGVPWSPSRILGNFLIYRELEHAFPPGEKKRAMKRDKRPAAISKTAYPYGRYGARPGQANMDSHRHLVGSLTDSYEFKSDGLVKKTISVTVGSVSHHLVSYYNLDDVVSGRFNSPSKDPQFNDIIPRAELTSKQSFRTPLDEVEPMDQMNAFDYGRPARYDMNTAGMQQQQRPQLGLSLPYSSSYPSNQGAYSTASYTMPSMTSSHSPLTLQSTGHGYNSFAASPVAYSASRTSQFDTASARPRYNSMGNTDLGSGVLASQQLRRPSAYDQHGGLDSANSMASFKSESTTDSGYSTQGYYTSSRDVSQAPTNTYASQRSLPSLPSSDSRHMSYDRPPHTSFSMPVDSMSRDNMWSMSNVPSSHSQAFPHLQQQWAGTGSS